MFISGEREKKKNAFRVLFYLPKKKRVEKYNRHKSIVLMKDVVRVE